MRVDDYRKGPYDMLLTLSGGRTIGVIRQGPALPPSRLRYRLRSIERLDSDETPFVTLVLTHGPVLGARSWAKERGSSGVSLLLEGGAGQGRPARNAIERGELAGEDAFADEEDLGFFQGQIGCGQHQV